MINKDGGGDNFSILWGDIELMGVPQSPPLRKSPVFGLEKGKTHTHSYPRSPQTKSALEYSFNHYFLLIHCINITSIFWGSVCRLIILNNFTERLYKTSNDFLAILKLQNFGIQRTQIHKNQSPKRKYNPRNL